MHYVKYERSMTSAPPSLIDAINRYLQFLQSEENKSRLTLSNYRQSLNLLTALLPLKSVKDFDKDSIRSYKQALSEFRTRQNKDLAVRTRNHHLTVLRAFLRYLLQEEELDVYPPDRIKRFKEEQRQVKVLQAEELMRLMNAPDLETRMGKRDRAILELFFSTGLRLQELRMLNRKDLNFQTREISVRGKRSKIRVVFLSDTSVHFLREYLDSRSDHLSPLFIRNPERATNVMPPGEEYR